MISKRAQRVDASGIRKVFDLGATLTDPINLSIGQPDFDAFEEVKLGAKKAIDSRKSGYTPTQGIPELRDKIRHRYGLAGVNDVEVFLTSGVSGGLALGYMAMLDPGDEILLPDPYFCLYRDLGYLLNIEPQYYDTYPDFRVRPEAIERMISPRTKALLVMNPGNPTGYSMTQDELDEIVEVARRANIWLIYDEIYSAFSYDAPHAKCFGKYEKTLLLSGFSKSHGIPGWRIGYALGPSELVSNMLKIQQYTYVCTPSIVQWAMVEGLEANLQPKIAEYKEKRDFIYGALSGCLKMEKPGGAFYLFPEAPGGSGTRFVERCVKQNLLVIPGNIFSRQDSHFRISFAAPTKMLERGVEVLQRLSR